MNNKTSSIPELKVVWVDTRFTHDEPVGFQEALWVQTTATPDRSWGVTVVFRNGGMMYRNLPPHAVAFDPNDHQQCWFLDHAQLWNCYGYQYEHMVCQHLADSQVRVKIGKEIFGGHYLFQTSFIKDSYSLQPEQDKTFIWVRLYNNRLTIQPTNRVTFRDASFIIDDIIPKLKLQTEIYRCSEYDKP